MIFHSKQTESTQQDTIIQVTEDDLSSYCHMSFIYYVKTKGYNVVDQINKKKIIVRDKGNGVIGCKVMLSNDVRKQNKFLNNIIFKIQCSDRNFHFNIFYLNFKTDILNKIKIVFESRFNMKFFAPLLKGNTNVLINTPFWQTPIYIQSITKKEINACLHKNEVNILNNHLYLFTGNPFIAEYLVLNRTNMDIDFTSPDTESRTIKDLLYWLRYYQYLCVYDILY